MNEWRPIQYYSVIPALFNSVYFSYYSERGISNFSKVG